MQWPKFSVFLIKNCRRNHQILKNIAYRSKNCQKCVKIVRIRLDIFNQLSPLFGSVTFFFLKEKCNFALDLMNWYVHLFNFLLYVSVSLEFLTLGSYLSFTARSLVMHVGVTSPSIEYEMRKSYNQINGYRKENRILKTTAYYTYGNALCLFVCLFACLFVCFCVCFCFWKDVYNLKWLFPKPPAV